MAQVVIHEQPGRHTYSAEHSRARVIGESVKPPVAELAIQGAVERDSDKIEIIEEE
jgi:hypothetical protein